MAEQAKIVADSIELAGNRDECGHCEEGDKFFSKEAAAHPGTVQYQYWHEGTPQEQEIRQGKDFYPVIRHCKVNEKGEKIQCKLVDGFNPDDWHDLGKHLGIDTKLTSDPALADLESDIEI